MVFQDEIDALGANYYKWFSEFFFLKNFHYLATSPSQAQAASGRTKIGQPQGVTLHSH